MSSLASGDDLDEVRRQLVGDVLLADLLEDAGVEVVDALAELIEERSDRPLERRVVVEGVDGVALAFVFRYLARVSSGTFGAGQILSARSASSPARFWISSSFQCSSWAR